MVGASMRPVATDAQQCHDLSIHTACCYWGYGQTTGRLCLAFLVCYMSTAASTTTGMVNETVTQSQTLSPDTSAAIIRSTAKYSLQISEILVNKDNIC